MRILFLTHRFGKEVVGGAELHLWNLAQQIAKLGCEVDVATSQEKEIHPFLRFGLFWSNPDPSRIEHVPVEGAASPIRILRFPVKNLPKPQAAIYQKIVQRRWEREELAMEPRVPLDLPQEQTAPLLLTGWHLPEQQDNHLARWTMSQAAIQLPPMHTGSLFLRGFAPRNVEIRLEHALKTRVLFRGKGNFQIQTRLADLAHSSIARLHISPTYKPLRDTRELGVMISHISIANQGQIEVAPLHIDHRQLRALNKENFIGTYLQRAQARPRLYSWLFDQLRGPRCPGLGTFLARNGGDYDWVIAGILPFSILPMAMRVRKTTPFRLAALPLFHVDDDFYYWSHYLAALRESDICLANSSFAQGIFYPSIKAKSIVAGAGVDEDLFRKPGIDGKRFRKRFGIDPEEKVILSVGRKTGAKGYQTLIQAIDNIQYRMKCRLVLIGPDEDRLPIASPNCTYLGPLAQDDLLDAYDACNVFCLMSESESFGMVYVEAWMREKPVIGNRNCGPVALLIDESRDGLLASNREELEQQIIALLKDPERCRTMGRNGLEKAQAMHTWQAIAKRILSHFEENRMDFLITAKNKPMDE